jgi:hypothetical protein
LAPSDTRLGRHPGASFPLQQTTSKQGVRFGEVVIGLLGLPDPIKTRHGASTNQSLPLGPKQHSP